MKSLAHFLLHDSINRMERYFYRLALYRREKKMGSGYDENLSREMDCLQSLIDGSNDHGGGRT